MRQIHLLVSASCLGRGGQANSENCRSLPRPQTALEGWPSHSRMLKLVHFPEWN